MKKFSVDVDVTYRATITVEAEDWEEALDIADDMYLDGYDDLNDAICEAIKDNNIVDHDIYVREY